MDPVTPLAMRRAILSALAAVDGLWDVAKLDLFVGSPTIGPNTSIGDLTLATFTGYVQKTVTWGAVLNQPTGIPVLQGGQGVFAATGSAVTNMVAGWVVHNSTSGIIRAQAFDAPVAINGAGQGVVVDLAIPYAAS